VRYSAPLMVRSSAVRRVEIEGYGRWDNRVGSHPRRTLWGLRASEAHGPNSPVIPVCAEHRMAGR
jgi:hypothetical protein